MYKKFLKEVIKRAITNNTHTICHSIKLTEITDYETIKFEAKTPFHTYYGYVGCVGHITITGIDVHFDKCEDYITIN